MTPEDKYFYIYLLTNPNTTQIGIYQITKKQIAFEMGYSVESVNSLLDRFENCHKIIKYNNQTRELALLNWGKYNLTKGGKPVMDCIKKELSEVKDRSLIAAVAERIPNEKIKQLFLQHADDTLDDTYHDTLDDTYHDTLDDTYHDTLDDTYHDTLDDTYHDTSAMRGQKEKEKEKEKEKYHYPDDDDDLKEVSRFYQENIGVMPPYVSDCIEDWCKTLSPDLVKEAIKRAVTQNARRWSYIESILKGWHDQNIKTVEEAKAEDERRRTRKGKVHVVEPSPYKLLTPDKFLF
ncbi:DnaD domain protein [Geobacillus sp. MMMUD3]|nr:DnaD domain protein [Geobacillus sp. MMMUD3]